MWSVVVVEFQGRFRVTFRLNTTDTSITASWAYDAGSRTLVSYDTPAIIQKKASFIKSLGLGGGMWWESSGDKKGSESLVSTVSPAPALYSASLDTDETIVRHRCGWRRRPRPERKSAQLPAIQIRQPQGRVPQRALDMKWLTDLHSLRS